MDNTKLEQLNFLIAGQLKTSKTETLENYYRDRVSYLGVVGISNPYAIKGLARCTLYYRGKQVKEFPLFSMQLKGIYWFNQFLLGPVFLIYFVLMFWSVLKLRKRFDIFIGIACFSTLFGIFLKKLGIVKNIIYYTLDYYPKPRKFHINTLINKIIWYLDKYCCKQACLVWNLSTFIPEAREKLINFDRKGYNYIHVPITYGKSFLRLKPLEAIEMDTLVFVGTLSWNQGLQLVIESMPELIKNIPKLKVRIIGKGPSSDRIRHMIDAHGLNDRFILHGFIEKDEDMLDIISNCTIGICPWTDEMDNNVIYTEPGKPKLYTFCGIPVIITKVTALAQEIDNVGAGIAINYDKQEFIDAVLKILKDAEILKRYRKNAYDFAIKYTTEAVFESVDERIMHLVQNHM